MNDLIEINAAGYERRDAIAEIALARGGRALRPVEVDAQGAVIDRAIPYQFDGETLVLMLKGTTPPDAVRRFRLVEDSTGPPVTPLVALTDNVEHEAQASFKITTQNATYLYHKLGAGFASMIDADGSDWLSYHPFGGSDGKYRGIPNLVHPEGHFHPGGTECASEIVHQGPLKLTIDSQSNDSKWACRWEIYPDHARLTVLKVDHPYWFLYEGTPGGVLDEAGDYMVRSDGTRTPAAESWEGAIPAPEWIYFGAANTKRVLYLVHHEADDAIDSYWPMEHNMTVFGFGRSGLEKYMTRTPAHFTVGFAERGDYEAAKQVIDAVLYPLEIKTSKLT